ncbi:MAG: hypothetical protein SWX82_02225 [Cyanobacteriota bacterium]|nr:hypothetical protein [Cyanobacteriota bacterium]
MKNYNIITLGPSGSGKTVFLASLFKQLSTSPSKEFFLTVSDNEQRKKLNEIYSRIIGKNQDWPSGTRDITHVKFTGYVKNLDLDLENFPVCQFTYIDYGGGLITDTLPDQRDVFDFQENVPNADAVLAMIDGLKLLKLMRGENLENETILQFLLQDLPNMMQLINQCKRDTSVDFIISKWDLLEGNYNLSEITERLREKSPEFNNVVSNRIKAGCPVRLIPVSSIGMDFASLQSDGLMKKNPGAIPKPFHLEIPIAYVLIDDRVKAGNEALKSSSEKTTLLARLKNSFSNGRADRVRDWEKAHNHLVISFSKCLNNFEEEFPEANLGTKSRLALPSIHTLREHQKVVCSVGFTSNSKTLFSSSDDRTVLFWDVARGNLQKEIVREKSGWVLANLSQDNQKLFTAASADRSIKVWDANTGKLLYELPKEHSEQIGGLVVSLDGSTLISSSRDRTVKVWQLETHSARVIHSLSEHQGFVYALAVSPNGHTLVAGGTDKKMLIWELPVNNDEFRGFRALEHPDFIKALAFSSDGKILVSGGGNKTIYVWDTRTWKIRNELKEHTGAIWSLAIGPDNRFLASGSDDGEIRVWNLSDGTSRTILTEHTGIITTLAFSPDNQILASGSYDKTIKIWQIV